MTEKEFLKGWNLLYAAFNRKVDKIRAELVLHEFFGKLHGGQFFAACRKACIEVEQFPSVASILKMYRELSIDFQYYKPKTCSKCEDGYIHFRKVYHEIPYNCAARCNCEAGSVLQKVSSFEKLFGPIEKFTYCGEYYVVVITPDEAMDKGIWEKLCAMEDWNTDLVEIGEIKIDSEIFLTLQEAKEIGLNVEKLMKDSEMLEALIELLKGKGPKEIGKFAGYFSKVIQQKGILKAMEEFNEHKSNIPKK